MLRAVALVVAVAAVVIQTSSASSNFSYALIVEATGTCPTRDSCADGDANSPRSGRGPSGLTADYKSRNCFCDEACATYGDCCIDAKAIGRTVAGSITPESFKCVELKQYGNVNMVSVCPASWTSSDDTRSACEQLSEDDSDPMSTLPVTDERTGVTFRNYHCAICHGQAANVTFWQPRLECPGLQSSSSRVADLQQDDIMAKLRYDSQREQWGIDLDTDGISVFYDCVVDPVTPDNVASKLRACIGNLVKQCPEGYANATQAEYCHAYTGVLYDTTRVYRNAHCALCNGVNVTRLDCFNVGQLARSLIQPTFSSVSFAVLFDISGDQNDAVGQVCPLGALYDPFFKKCRNVVCAAGQTLQNGKCSTPGIASSTTTTTTTTTTSTTTTTTTTSEETTTVRAFDDDRIVFPEDTTIAPESDVTTTTTITPIPFTTIDETEVVPITTTSLPFYDEADNSSAAEFSTCAKFELSPGEYEVLPDGQVFVPVYNLTFTNGNFLMEDGGQLLICAITDDADEDKFSEDMGYVTFACLGVSVVCLLLHVMATAVTPELRNLSGKNLLSLTLALLGGYASFIAAMFMHESGSAGCFVVAVCMYYFFLSSFSWMLVISFDICRTLRRATTQLRISAGERWRRFAAYSAAGWLTPAVLVAFTVAVDLLQEASGVPEDYWPKFGQSDLCWFSSKKALLVYFAVPFACIVCVNTLLFVLSACMVYRAMRDNAVAHTTTCGPKTNFYLYLRLAVIMGLTWIIGLVAAFVDEEAVWYGFVAFNTLQGLFIFITFTCTRKVLGSISKRFGCETHSRGLFGGTLAHKADMSSFKWSKASSTKRSNLESDGFQKSPVAALSYTARGKTMYTVPSNQINCITQNSFDGRYY